jgi:hypothetical protein
LADAGFAFDQDVAFGDGGAVELLGGSRFIGGRGFAVAVDLVE